MNVQVVTLPHSQVSLDIEVDSAAIGHAIDRAYQRLAQRYTVPGFRKGKAPRNVLEAAIGRSAVIEEAADIAVNDGYAWALKQTGLEPITTPEVSMQSEGLDPSQPLFYSAKFYVYPAVTLGDYAAIRVTPPKTEVADEAVEAVLTRMAEREAPWEPVEDRPAQPGDMAVIALRGTVGDESVVDEAAQEYFLDPALETEATANPLNLTPHIGGLSIGEARDVAIELPADYQPEQYAGKTMTTHIELQRLEHKVVPELDDAFAQSVGEYASLDDLRAQARRSLEAEQRSRDAEAFVAQVMGQAVDAAFAEPPPPMVEDEIHRTLDNLKSTVESRRYMTFDLYLRLIGKTMEELHEEARGPAEIRVKSNLVLEAIAKAEGIEAPRQQVDAELREVAALPTVRERDRRRILTSPSVRARVETRLVRRLALERLLQIANPKSMADSADNESSEGALDKRVLQEAAQSHADALESAAPHAGEEER